MWTVGVLGTATLLGSALAAPAVGAWGHRFAQRRLLIAAALVACELLKLGYDITLRLGLRKQRLDER